MTDDMRDMLERLAEREELERLRARVKELEARIAIHRALDAHGHLRPVYSVDVAQLQSQQAEWYREQLRPSVGPLYRPSDLRNIDMFGRLM